MVRKWSYLTPTKELLVNKSLSELTKCYSFKVFRMTTRFKKYQRNGTSFVRKQDSSRKRQTSWLTLLSIFAQWSLQYIKYRQYLRYYQTLSLYKYQFAIPNIFVISKKLNLFNPDLSFTTSTITNQLLYTLNNTKVNTLSKIKHSNTLYSNTNSLEILKEVNISGYVHDNQLFTELQSLSNYKQENINLLYLTMYTSSLKQVTELYKILILLSLYKTNILWI
jgi:hypothetical protein